MHVLTNRVGSRGRGLKGEGGGGELHYGLACVCAIYRNPPSFLSNGYGTARPYLGTLCNLEF